MIELKILVDDIDYNSLTELLVPLLAEKLEKDGKGGILGGVLSGNRGMAVSMARTLLDVYKRQAMRLRRTRPFRRSRTRATTPEPARWYRSRASAPSTSNGSAAR